MTITGLAVMSINTFQTPLMQDKLTVLLRSKRSYNVTIQECKYLHVFRKARNVFIIKLFAKYHPISIESL